MGTARRSSKTQIIVTVMCDELLHTFRYRLKNGGNVDGGFILGGHFSPTRPVLKDVHRHVLLGNTAQQCHHSMRWIEEFMQSSLQLHMDLQHGQQFFRDKHQNAFAALEILKVVSMELICGADGVQYHRCLAEFPGRLQDVL